MSDLENSKEGKKRRGRDGGKYRAAGVRNMLNIGGVMPEFDK